MINFQLRFGRAPKHNMREDGAGMGEIMKILGIDSSGLVASAALIENDTLVAEYTVNFKKTHSQTLLPMLNEISTITELKLDSIDAIAVAAGPGSFTGLRIGSATAKGLGLALDKPIIGIPTVDGLAYNLYGCQDLICPLMDARRAQTYTGLYEFRSNEFITLREQCAVSIAEIIAEVNAIGRKVIFLGDGIMAFTQYIKEHCSVKYTFAPAHVNKQRAASVAALAQLYYVEGKQQSAREYKPIYLRLSQAERERLQREDG